MFGGGTLSGPKFFFGRLAAAALRDRVVESERGPKTNEQPLEWSARHRKPTHRHNTGLPIHASSLATDGQHTQIGTRPKSGTRTAHVHTAHQHHTTDTLQVRVYGTVRRPDWTHAACTLTTHHTSQSLSKHSQHTPRLPRTAAVGPRKSTHNRFLRTKHQKCGWSTVRALKTMVLMHGSVRAPSFFNVPDGATRSGVVRARYRGCDRGRTNVTQQAPEQRIRLVRFERSLEYSL